jgi:hypothetical protein
MATNSYMAGRKKYGRPQGMLWADNPGTIIDGSYVPLGNEVLGENNFTEPGSFIILSDDNREAIDFTQERIEKRERMINGRMRSYHIADKLSISASWTMLPSRSFATAPEFDQEGNPTTLVTEGNTRPFGSALRKDQQYTTDGGAGGVELLDWYENHPGSFWVYLSYDKYTNFAEKNDETPFDNLAKYSQIVEMYFADFSYTVQKRGASNYDFWDISVSLEEV